MYEPHLQHHAYAFPISPNLINWSALERLPSDTAALFWALEFGLAYLSRRLAIPMMLYMAG